MNNISGLQSTLKHQVEKFYEEAIKAELKKHYTEYYGLPIDELSDGDIIMMLEQEDIIVKQEGGDWDKTIKQVGEFSFTASMTPITIKLYRRL